MVDDIVLYIAVVDNFERVPNKQTYVLDLEETEVLPRKISGGSTVQENFTVSKSTFALTVALQSKNAGRNTLFPPSRMVVTGDHLNELESLRVDYAGQSRPQTMPLLNSNKVVILTLIILPIDLQRQL